MHFLLNLSRQDSSLSFINTCGFCIIVHVILDVQSYLFYLWKQLFCVFSKIRKMYPLCFVEQNPVSIFIVTFPFWSKLFSSLLLVLLVCSPCVSVFKQSFLCKLLNGVYDVVSMDLNNVNQSKFWFVPHLIKTIFKIVGCNHSSLLTL